VRLAWSNNPDRSKVITQTKRNILVIQVGGLGVGLTTQPIKNKLLGNLKEAKSNELLLLLLLRLIIIIIIIIMWGVAGIKSCFLKLKSGKTMQTGDRTYRAFLY